MWKEHKEYDLLINKNGKVKRKSTNRDYKPSTDKFGYKIICYSEKSKNIKKILKVHRLVAETFIDNPENKAQVNHLNGNKTDNRIENLEWVSNSENQLHAYKNGLSKGHELRPDAKLTMENARYIRENYIYKDKVFNSRYFAKMFGVSNNTILKLLRGEIWKEYE